MKFSYKSFTFLLLSQTSVNQNLINKNLEYIYEKRTLYVHGMIQFNLSKNNEKKRLAATFFFLSRIKKYFS